MITFVFKMKTANPSNGSIGMSRGAAMAEARRNKTQRAVARKKTREAFGKPRPIFSVTLTRISPGSLDDHDNVRSALKHVADGIAKALGVDDGAGLIRWQYAPQEHGEAAVRVQIERLP